MLCELPARPAAVSQIETPPPSGLRQLVMGTTYVTAVVAGRVVIVPRQAVSLSDDGALTLPVQDDM